MNTCRIVWIKQLFNNLLFIFIDISSDKWDLIMKKTGFNMVDLRDNRYNQIIHMVSAACGAEDFYTIEVKTSKNFYNMFKIFN